MPDSLPILNEVINPDEVKAATAFYLAFFRAELLCEQLKSHGVLVTRKIIDSGSDVVVNYYLPVHDQTLEIRQISLVKSDPYDSRCLVMNVLQDTLAKLEAEKLAARAKEALEQALSEGELQTLASLHPEISKLLGGR